MNRATFLSIEYEQIVLQLTLIFNRVRVSEA